jgi:hypothetical protein
MGKWSINELDKSKTEQSISNEQIRLDHCKIERSRLYDEYVRMEREHRRKEQELIDKLDKLYLSIESGEKFIKECQEHLKDFENAETN